MEKVDYSSGMSRSSWTSRAGGEANPRVGGGVTSGPGARRPADGRGQLAQADASGSSARVPPRPSQALDQRPSVYQRCQSWLTPPRTNTSILPDPQETAPGPEVRTPPRLSHADQAPPANERCRSWFSAPRATTSRRPLPHDATSGAELSTPPRFSHLDQTPLVYQRCHRWLSVPQANTSIRPGPHDTAPGAAFIAPPRSSH